MKIEEISDRDARRIIKETKVLDKLDRETKQAMRKNQVMAETLGWSFLLLCFHALLKFLVERRFDSAFSADAEFVWKCLIGWFSLIPLVYITCSLKEARMFRVLFMIGGLCSCCYMLQVLSGVYSKRYYDSLPLLASIWILSVIQIDMGLAFVQLALVLAFKYFIVPK